MQKYRFKPLDHPEFAEPSLLKQYSLAPVKPLPDAPVAANMPLPSQSFLGLTSSGNCGGGLPPDPVGDVGPNHYVEAINTSVGIFSKTGSPLAAFTFDSLWSTAQTGTPCDNSNGGAPTVVYDPISDRWIVADLGFSSVTTPPFHECIAVSKTGDPISGGRYFYPIRADDATPMSTPVLNPPAAQF